MKRVLVAEDETSIREFIVINLQRSGYEVSQADNGRAALEMYEAAGGDFDVVLLDIMMPEMDGLEVCKRLRSMSQTVGIIMLTAKTQEIDRVTGLLVGADDYVSKPFSPSELMARSKSLIASLKYSLRTSKFGAADVYAISLIVQSNALAILLLDKSAIALVSLQSSLYF